MSLLSTFGLPFLSKVIFSDLTVRVFVRSQRLQRCRSSLYQSAAPESFAPTDFSRSNCFDSKTCLSPAGSACPSETSPWSSSHHSPQNSQKGSEFSTPHASTDGTTRTIKASTPHTTQRKMPVTGVLLPRPMLQAPRSLTRSITSSIVEGCDASVKADTS